MARAGGTFASLAGRLLALSALMIAAPTIADPFATRDQNPFLATLSLPEPMPARPLPSDQWAFAGSFNWSSSAIVQRNARERLIVDAESREFRLSLGRALANGMQIRLQLPYRYTGEGKLDSFIDGWHDVFGLPEGARRSLPEGALRITYDRNGVREFDLRSSASGIGDISLDFGRTLWDSHASSVAAWLSIKLPTGDADELTGSGATDASLIAAGEYHFGSRWSIFGQAAASWLGRGEVLSGQQRRFAWSSLAGLQANVASGLDFKLQLDTHRPVFDDTALDFLSAPVILTIGGAYRFARGWQLDFGVSEDIAVDASPDVVFVVGVKRSGE